MAFSEVETIAINNHPLNNATFPAKLRHLKESNETWRDDIAELLAALLRSRAVRKLRSPHEGGNSDMSAMLNDIMGHVFECSLDFTIFHPLIDTVVAHSSDIDICIAVINLVKAASLIQGTPVSRSSRRLPAENELFYELRNCTHRSVPGFFDKYFDSAKWDDTKKEMLKSILDSHDGKRWLNFPAELCKSRILMLVIVI